MIINIASDLARRPLANMAPYVATKFGLLGFSGSLLREARAHGVKVSAVLPGIIDTAFNGAQEGSKQEAWALRAKVLACQVVDLFELPENVVIDELTIHPLHQDF
jgi:short-subunit dehydrogenase